MSIFEIRKQLLAKVMGERSTAEFCREFKQSPSYISQILSGARNLGDQAAQRLEKELGLEDGTLSMPQLADMAGDTRTRLEPAPHIQKWKTVNIVGIAQMGENGYWCEMHEGDGEIDVITRDPDAYALRVRGDSMAPAIRNNWIVWCEPNHELVSGEYVMVQTKDGRSMVKELLFVNSLEISLMSINPGFGRINIPIEQVQQAHYVGGIVPPSKARL